VSPEEAGNLTGAAAAPVRGEGAGCTECIAKLEVPVKFMREDQRIRSAREEFEDTLVS
jgi:hypothetical protein